MKAPLEHEIKLDLASGAQLTILSFSDREHRWIFAYRYRGLHDPGVTPEIVNDVRLTAEYTAGQLAQTFILSMHVIIPSRLGREIFAGLDISPGAKTYLEFTYERSAGEYRLVEICKGARERVRLDGTQPAILRAVEFPFPVLDRIPGTHRIVVPFRTNDDGLDNFILPMQTLRQPS